MSYWKNRRVLVTGGTGFVGRTLVPIVKKLGAVVFVPHRPEFDLTVDVDKLFCRFIPDVVIHLAADLGGIGYLRLNPGSVFFNNVMMNTLLMEKARENDVEKFVGVNTINCYPEDAEMPLSEKSIWGGRPEENVAAYGFSKRMMIFQSEVYSRQYGFNSINLILDNIYGPYDNFDLDTSRVIPAVIRKCVEARENNDDLVVWGSGKVARGFLYVDDAVKGIMSAVERYSKSVPVNIGGCEIKIKDLVELIAEVSGFEGEIVWDVSKPDGQVRRCLDVSRAEKEFGFKANVDIREGVKRTIRWYERNRLFHLSNLLI